MFSSYAKLVDVRNPVRKRLDAEIENLAVHPKTPALKRILRILKIWHKNAGTKEMKEICQEWYVKFALLAIKSGKEGVVL